MNKTSNIFLISNTQYFNHLGDEEENNNDISDTENTDRTDWRILHRQKVPPQHLLSFQAFFNLKYYKNLKKCEIVGFLNTLSFHRGFK